MKSILLLTIILIATPIQAAEDTPNLTVATVIQCSDQITTERASSYLHNALRAISDVRVRQATNSNFMLRVVVMRPRSGGYVSAVQYSRQNYTPTLTWAIEHDGPINTSQRYLLGRVVGELEKHIELTVLTGGDLKQLMEGIAASFDTSVLEPERQSTQLRNELIDEFRKKQTSPPAR